MSEPRRASPQPTPAVALDLRGRCGDGGRRLHALTEISRLVTLGLEESAILRHLTEAVARLLAAPYAGLWMLDEETGDLVVAATAGPLSPAIELGLRRPAGRNSLNQVVLASGRLYQTADVEAHPNWINHAMTRRYGLRTYVGVPLMVGEERYGLLTLLFHEPLVIGDEDLELVESVAAQAAAALRNARLHEATERQARRLAALLDVNRRLALGPRLDELLARITEEAAHLLEAEGARLRLLDGDALVLRATYEPSGPPEIVERVALDGSLSGRVATEQRPIISPDAGGDPRADASILGFARAHGPVAWLGVPLRGRDRVLGTLAVLRGAERRFGPADVELLEAFADQAAIAVEDADLLATSRRQAAEARAVADVARAITGSLDPQAVLELVVEHAGRLLGTEQSAVAVVEPEGGEAIYRFVARRGLSDEFPVRLRPRHGRDGTTAMAIVERRPVWSADVLNDPALDLSPATRAAVEAEGYRSVLSVPLLTAGRVLGALVVYRRPVGPFSPDEVELLRIFADQAAIALDNARAFELEQARRRQLEAVREVTAELTRELDLTTLLELILRRSASLVEADAGALYLWDDAEQALVPRAWRGLGDWIGAVRFRLGEGAAGVAAERRAGVIVDDYGAWPPAHPSVRAEVAFGAVLAEPIVYQDRLIGVVSLARETGGRRFGEADRHLLGLFADQAAVAIENARLFERVAAAEALRELARLKAEFLGAASHELRTPLTLIHGYAELLHEYAARLPPDRVALMAGAIYSGSSTMVRLVDDLLDLSRFEQGLVDLRPSRTDLVGVLRSLVDAFRAQPGGERLVAELPESLEAYVDPERLVQAVSNLLINALRYAPEGPIVVRAERRGDDVLVEVADRGPGLALAAQGRIWEKFYREEAAINSPHRGSGLGLTVVKQLVELHGGRVGVFSRPGRGAKFWFSIPRRGAP